MCVTHLLIIGLVPALLTAELMTDTIPPPPTVSTDHQDHSRKCPACGHHSSQEDRTRAEILRLEAIKYQILTKLGLEKKPNVTSPIPREMVMETLHRAVESRTIFEEVASRDEDIFYDEEEDQERTSEIISFAQPGYTFNGHTLLKFARSSDDKPSETQVKSASLWVKVDYTSPLTRHLQNIGYFEDKKITLYVFKVNPLVSYNATDLSSTLVNLEMLKSTHVPLGSLGWQQFDISNAVQHWYASGLNEKLQLLVDCSGCGSLVNAVLFSPSEDESSQETDWEWRQKHQPFLVLRTIPLLPRRVRRRVLECGPQIKQCCKQRFYVNFKQLGWDDWIIAPRGYYANYCRGDCGGIHRTPDTYGYYHTHVIEEYRKLGWEGHMQPCCAPVKVSSMSLIYYGPDMNIIKRDLPKMVVDECGCP